jgi:rhodanese-related sulfurtransferase
MLQEATVEDDELDREYPDLSAAAASGLTLVDIREPWERASDDPEQQIALHVPLSAFVNGEAALPAGRYLLVCAHGVRSHALAEHLRSHGHREVYSLAGGLAGLAGV